MIGSDTEARKRRPRLAVTASVSLPLAGVGATIALWWLAILVFDIQSFILPTPGAVVSALGTDPGYLLDNAWVTLTETLQGYGLAVVAGILIGTVLASSRVVERAMYPQLVALNSVPKLAFAPLFVVWLGWGQGPKVFMAVLMCFFPIVLATVTGLTTTPTDLVEMSRSLSASRWQMFIKVRLPAALPQIFIGLKAAMPLAVIGALVGELLGSDSGLGFVIQNATSNTALAFAAIVLLAAMSIVLYYAVVAVERVLLPWVRETTA
jgi:NitT/TauT family transport system permease protein